MNSKIGAPNESSPLVLCLCSPSGVLTDFRRLKVSGNGPVPCLLILLNFVAVVSDRRQAATRNLVVSISALTERRYRSALPIAMRSAPSIVRALYENAPRVRYLCADAHLLASLLRR